MRRTLASAALALLGLLAVPAQAKTVCTLLMDARSAQLLLKNGDCASRVTPASTFKIALAVMGYDAGILKTAHEPVMRFRAGDPDWGTNWTRDTDPANWMRYSVLWYSQRIAAALGTDALTRYAHDFSYGNADFSGDPGFDNGLERAWVSSSLMVSPREQAAFLRLLVADGLPVDPKAMALAKSIVEVHQQDGWRFHGKTGGAYPRRADRSFDYARGWGWYVGWAESDAKTLIFVRLTQASERTPGSPGTRARDEFLREWRDLIAP